MIVTLRRIRALVVKEFLTILRDPKGRTILIAPPLLQLILFSFAATLEVKNVSLLVLNNDAGRHGQEIIQRLSGSPTFNKIEFVEKGSDFEPLIDEQKAMAAIHIPQDFSRRIENGETASLQVIFDGRRSNAAQITSGYITQVVNQYSQELLAKQPGSMLPMVITAERNWFNENLLFVWVIIPSLVAVLAVVITLNLTAMSVARERELGTFDQLLVSPLMPLEILIGKVIPAMAVGISEALFIFSMGLLLFGVPFRGSFLLLLLVMGIFLLSIVGFGLFISSLAKTQQQAILGAFMFMVPAISLSSFAAPIENMPPWLQKAVWLNPVEHAMVLLKGIFLKQMPLSEIVVNAWPLLVIGLVTLALSGWLFTKKLE